MFIHQCVQVLYISSLSVTLVEHYIHCITQCYLELLTSSCTLKCPDYVINYKYKEWQLMEVKDS